MIQHKLPLYYSPKYNGVFVIRRDNVIGGVCEFVDDAYTNILRYQIDKTFLQTCVRLNKRKLQKYSFLQKYYFLPKTNPVFRVNGETSYSYFEDERLTRLPHEHKLTF